MNLHWFAQVVVEAAVSAVISWVVFGVLALLWARRSLLPFLRKHAPEVACAILGKDDQ